VEVDDNLEEEASGFGYIASCPRVFVVEEVHSIVQVVVVDDSVEEDFVDVYLQVDLLE